MSASESPKHRLHGSRFRARRRAVDILFEAEARDIDPVAIVDDRVTLSRFDENGVAPVNPYTKEIVAGAAETLDHLDAMIAQHLDEDWELERISAVDRAVLRVAMWELLFNEEVPVATALVDAVEIASQYSGDEAPSYIHALLDSVAQKIDDARAKVAADITAENEPVVDDAATEALLEEFELTVDEASTVDLDEQPAQERTPIFLEETDQVRAELEIDYEDPEAAEEAVSVVESDSELDVKPDAEEA